MSEIPEDILQVGVGIADDIPARVTGINRSFAALVIARAILAERKRCAEVARHLNGWGPVGGNKVAEHIAKVIEAGA